MRNGDLELAGDSVLTTFYWTIFITTTVYGYKWFWFVLAFVPVRWTPVKWLHMNHWHQHRQTSQSKKIIRSLPTLIFRLNFKDLCLWINQYCSVAGFRWRQPLTYRKTFSTARNRRTCFEYINSSLIFGQMLVLFSRLSRTRVLNDG